MAYYRSRQIAQAEKWKHTLHERSPSAMKRIARRLRALKSKGRANERRGTYKGDSIR